MKKLFYFSLSLPIILSVFISCFFIPAFSINFTNILTQNSLTSHSSIFLLNSFIWPTPSYTNITSHFGYRNSPITHKKAYHGGIDIAAPENSPILAIADGFVSYIGWYGANGYSVILSHENGYKSIYGHISPEFIVSLGEEVKKGNIIAKVGPKYIPKKSYTTYQDSTGKYTNGATTRTTSTFCYH